MVLARFLFELVLLQWEIHASPEVIHRRQLAKFRKLVSYAVRHSPYYAQLIRDRRIAVRTCVPEDFPILTKQDLLEHFDEIVTDRRVTKAKVIDFLEASHDPDELFLGKYHVVHSSGSSGTRGYCLYTTAELIRGIVPFTLAGPPRLRQKIAYVAVTNGHFAGVAMATIAKRLPFFYKELRLFDIAEPFDAIVQALNGMQPTCLSGYTVLLHKLAEAQAAGKLRCSPTNLQAGGEALSEKDKRYIQQTFGAPVTNIYAASEHLVMGIGSDALGGMYLVETNCIYEIQPMATVVTNLYNYSMPLIRYEMNDQLRIRDRAGKLPFVAVEDVIGRSEYSPVFRNRDGQEEAISYHLLDVSIKGLRRLQLHIVGPERFLIKVCFEPGADESKTTREITAYFTRLLRDKRMDTVAWSLERVGDLPVNPATGKFQVVVHDK